MFFFMNKRIEIDAIRRYYWEGFSVYILIKAENLFDLWIGQSRSIHFNLVFFWMRNRKWYFNELNWGRNDYIRILFKWILLLNKCYLIIQLSELWLSNDWFVSYWLGILNFFLQRMRHGNHHDRIIACCSQFNMNNGPDLVSFFVFLWSTIS